MFLRGDAIDFSHLLVINNESAQLNDYEQGDWMGVVFTLATVWEPKYKESVTI